MTKKLFKTSFNFILFQFSLLGLDLESPLRVKVLSETTSQKDKMVGQRKHNIKWVDWGM